MFSFRDLLPERSEGGQRASFQYLDLHNNQQLGSLFLGSLLVLTGTALRRSILGFLIMLSGASILHRNLKGSGQPVRPGRKQPRRSPIPQRRPSPMSQRTPGGGVPDHAGRKLVQSITIDRPRNEVFQFVRNLENASRYIKNVESVQVLDDKRSHWIARAPDGDIAEWYFEIINEHPGEMIAWQSLPGSDIQHAGSIRFEADADGAGTVVRLSLEFAFEESAFEEDVARILGDAPEQQLIEDFGRLKFLLESGTKTLRVSQAEPTV